MPAAVFNTTIRLPVEVHARAIDAANALGVSLNTYYVDAIAARNQQVQAAAAGALPLPPPQLDAPADREALRYIIENRLGAALRAPGGRGKPAHPFIALGITLRPDAHAMLTDLRRRTGLSKGVVVETGVRLLHACMKVTHPTPEEPPQ